MIEFVRMVDEEDCLWTVINDEGKYVSGIVHDIVELTDDKEKAIKFYNEESAWGVALELHCRTLCWFGVEVVGE